VRGRALSLLPSNPSLRSSLIYGLDQSAEPLLLYDYHGFSAIFDAARI
jgi:hypothetical protein